MPTLDNPADIAMLSRRCLRFLVMLLFYSQISFNTVCHNNEKQQNSPQVSSVESYFEHTNFSHRDLLDDRIVLGFEKLLDGDANTGFLVTTFEDNAVRTFSERRVPFVLVHCSVCSSVSQTLSASCVNLLKLSSWPALQVIAFDIAAVSALFSQPVTIAASLCLLCPLNNLTLTSGNDWIDPLTVYN